VVLIARAKLLATENPDRKILFFCYNRSLVVSLQC
jgi:superfamily I DNA and RNA helicase